MERGRRKHIEHSVDFSPITAVTAYFVITKAREGKARDAPENIYGDYILATVPRNKA